MVICLIVCLNVSFCTNSFGSLLSWTRRWSVSGSGHSAPAALTVTEHMDRHNSAIESENVYKINGAFCHQGGAKSRASDTSDVAE